MFKSTDAADANSPINNIIQYMDIPLINRSLASMVDYGCVGNKLKSAFLAKDHQIIKKLIHHADAIHADAIHAGSECGQFIDRIISNISCYNVATTALAALPISEKARQRLHRYSESAFVLYDNDETRDKPYQPGNCDYMGRAEFTELVDGMCDSAAVTLNDLYDAARSGEELRYALQTIHLDFEPLEEINVYDILSRGIANNHYLFRADYY
jgi:hypothetical protein